MQSGVAGHVEAAKWWQALVEVCASTTALVTAGSADGASLARTLDPDTELNPTSPSSATSRCPTKSARLTPRTCSS